MKVIIAGSRDINDYSLVEEAIEDSQYTISEVVSGKAKGVDYLGEVYAKRKHIPVKDFPADWDTYGKAGGPIRNEQMAKYADALIAIWDGESKGTKNMIDAAKKAGIYVYVKRTDQ